MIMIENTMCPNCFPLLRHKVQKKSKGGRTPSLFGFFSFGFGKMRYLATQIISDERYLEWNCQVDLEKSNNFKESCKIFYHNF